MSAATDDRRQAAVRNVEHEIGTLLRRIRKGLSERAVQVHPELNPTSYLILTTLSEHGACRAAHLADVFALDKGSVSRVVHQLLQLGLIERSPDPADGRASILSATDEAVRRIDSVRGDRRPHFEDRLDEWEVLDIEDLADRLGRFNHALSEHVAVPVGS